MRRKEKEHNLVKVFCGSLWEAQLIEGLLKSNNIACTLRNNTLSAVTSPYTNAGGDVWVMVNSIDEKVATIIIEECSLSSTPYN